MELKGLIEDIARYDGTIINLAEEGRASFILHLDFKIEDVQKLLLENPDCNAVRVYLACEEDYKPYGVIAPVLSQSGTTKSDAGVTYFKDIAHCPPRCSKDFGFSMDSDTETQTS
jgi:hypothetical protein